MPHTPGPWHVTDNNEVHDANRLVASEIMGERPEIYQANAHLIAAAPDLLEACKGIVAAAELHGTEGPEFFDARNDCLAAIAKAEGKPANAPDAPNARETAT